MGFNKFKIGQLIRLHKEKCNIPNLPQDKVSGINKDKEFFEPSLQVGNNTKNYQVVPSGFFACNLMHVGRDIVLPIALNTSGQDKYISPAYMIFSIKEDAPLLKDYLRIMLKSDEMDRFFWFHTDSSVREGMSWEDFCDVEINLPSISIQQKYVNVYNSLVENQRVFERGLEDMNLICSVYIEELRRTTPCKRLEQYIIQTNYKNNDKTMKIMGISNSQSFQKPNSRIDGVNVLNYKQVKPMEFAYSPIHINEGSIALNLSDKTYAISPIYATFRTDSTQLLPQYLMLWFQRSEFVRYCDFHAIGSARDSLSFEDLQSIEIPVPDIATQQNIANIYNAYVMRKNINERLKAQIKDICPILIKGSLEEASA